jgi:hypothetical protein
MKRTILPIFLLLSMAALSGCRSSNAPICSRNAVPDPKIAKLGSTYYSVDESYFSRFGTNGIPTLPFFGQSLDSLGDCPRHETPGPNNEAAPEPRIYKVGSAYWVIDESYVRLFGSDGVEGLSFLNQLLAK